MGQGRLEAFSDGVIAIIIAILLAFTNPWISFALYILVAVMWLIPDRRIERVLDM
jgi:uncharacterized membrane protein